MPVGFEITTVFIKQRSDFSAVESAHMYGSDLWIYEKKFFCYATAIFS